MTRRVRDALMDATGYTPPALLEIPFQIKPGYVARWLRVSLRGQDDLENIVMRKREGWEFLKLEDIPEEHRPQFDVFDSGGRLSGLVRRGDLALGIIPAEKAEARKAYYEGLARRGADAINGELMKHNDRRMPVYNESSSETITRGRSVKFAGS